MDISEGRVRPDHKGRYILGSGSRNRAPPKKLDDYFKVELVTPTAHAVEMAKSELKRKGEIIRDGYESPPRLRQKLRN